MTATDEERAMFMQLVKLIKAKSRERRRLELKSRISQLTAEELTEYMGLVKLAKMQGES